MANEIVRHDVQALVDSWLEAERNGNQFPVPFDAAWQIAGYSTKGNAKRKLTASNSGLVENEDFAFINSDKWTQDGRSSDLILMTCDAFKQFCLMAKTETGKNTRLYFIECEKKWKLVQQRAPQIAQEIEVIRAQQQLAQIEAQKEQAIAQAKQADLQLVQFRHYVVTALPEFAQEKILGYQVVKETEYRDRVIIGDEIVKDGSTIQKWELCRRFGFVTKNGKPDYKRLNTYLEDMPPDAFQEVIEPRTNREFRRDFLPMLNRLILGGERQQYLGE